VVVRVEECGDATPLDPACLGRYYGFQSAIDQLALRHPQRNGDAEVQFGREPA
jgi:hypothetical protein